MASVLSIVWNQFQRAEIEAELGRILAAPPFTNSQRCTSFLRHLVELTLNGEHDRIKERTLGIDVFHRDPHYDMNADPIVRRIAGDTRRRLTQYYQEHPNCSVRIRLEVGSYIPQFDFEPNPPAELTMHTASSAIGPFGAEDDAIQVAEAQRTDESLSAVPRNRNKWLLLTCATLLVAGFSFGIVRADFFRSTSYLVWKPLLASRGELIVCVSDRLPALFTNALSIAEAKAANPSAGGVEIATANLTAAARPRPKFIDMMTAFKITRELDSLGRSATLIPASTLKTRNLSNGPIILVGSINYPLSMMLQSRLRYSFRLDHSDRGRWIEDAQNPGNRDWKVDGAPEDAKVDYGMVTRYWDSDTGGWVFMICGIGPFGTEAAANLITDQVSSRLLPASIRSAQNFQIVLKTAVIDGSAGAPQILAVQTW